MAKKRPFSGCFKMVKSEIAVKVPKYPLFGIWRLVKWSRSGTFDAEPLLLARQNFLVHESRESYMNPS